MEDRDRINLLEQRILELTATVERMAASVPSPAETPAAPAAAAADTAVAASRRGMLRLVGAAAIAGAAVAVGVGVEPAAANDPNDLTLGTAKATAGLTRADMNTGAPGGGLLTAFFFQVGQAGNQVNFDSLAFSSALAGRTSTIDAPSGVFGSSNQSTGYGVVGANSDALGVGVHGTGATGVEGAGTVIGVNGSAGSFGVRGAGATGLLGVGATTGVNGTVTTAPGIGVSGSGGDTGIGVRGIGGDYAFAATKSNKANLFLQPNNDTGTPSPKTQPATRADAHVVGELENVGGDLWWCVAAGTPGTWRKLAGPTSAGAFHALTPGRVYDSRTAQPTGNVGRLSDTQTRTVSVSDRRNLATGAVDLANYVPLGATAVTANVTVVDTTASGFLAINPGGNTTVGAAAINWSGTGLILNNGVNLTLNAAREVTVICGGGGSTQFVIDVTGFFL